MGANMDPSAQLQGVPDVPKMADLPSRLHIYKPVWGWSVVGHSSWRLVAGYVSCDAANPVIGAIVESPCVTLAVVWEHGDRGGSGWSPTPLGSLAIGSSNVLKTHLQPYCPTSETSLAFSLWWDSEPVSEPVVGMLGTLTDWETFDLPSQGLWS